jgi:hypothetical protein
VTAGARLGPTTSCSEVQRRDSRTAARRDKFFGTPWHKNVPARIEVIATNGNGHDEGRLSSPHNDDASNAGSKANGQGL